MDARTIGQVHFPLPNIDFRDQNTKLGWEDYLVMKLLINKGEFITSRNQNTITKRT